MKTYVMFILAACLLLLQVADANEDITVETEIGPVEATKSEGPEDFQQTVRPLTAKEQEWLSLADEQAGKLVEYYTGKQSEGLVKPEKLDMAYSAWLRDTDKNKPEADLVIVAFGAAFGLYLEQTLDVEWEMVTDNYGTDMALSFSKNDIQTYPIASVAKRVERGEENFFVPLYYFLKEIGNKTDDK